MIVYTARWVLPVTRPAIDHGAVAVDGDRIAWVGPAADAPPGERVDLGECALMPGLVNVHSHLELTVMRGWLEDLPFRRWLLRLMFARREVLDADTLLASAHLGIAEGLLAGVTTYADTCESGIVHRAMRDMGVRGVMYAEVFGPADADASDALHALFQRIVELRGLDTPLVRTGISPHAPYSVSDLLFRGAAKLAIGQSLPIAVHAAESEAERLLVTRGEGEFADALRRRDIPVAARGTSTIELLERTQVLEARPLLIHCVRVSPEDIERIAAHGCSVAHCPASNAKLGHGTAPLGALLEAGVPVGLGSDSVASNNRMDILDEARLAVLFARTTQGSFTAVPAVTAIELATLGGAQALGMGNRIGALEAGRDADLAAFPLDAFHAIPIQAPETSLVHSTAGRGARFVTVAGRVLVREGRLVHDVTEEISVVRRASADLARSNPEAVPRWPEASRAE